MTTVDLNLITTEADGVWHSITLYAQEMWDKDPIIVGSLIAVIFLMLSMTIFKFLFKSTIIAILIGMTLSFLVPGIAIPSFIDDIKTKIYNVLLSSNSAYTGESNTTGGTVAQ